MLLLMMIISDWEH